MTVDGHLIATFTPLEGATQVVNKFLKARRH
jgi:phage terminase large subunit-like protein